MSTTSDPIARRVSELQAWIASGRILDAFHEFYAEDVVMQENDAEPCVGFAANLAREEAWLDSVESWESFEVLATAVEGDLSFVESASAYTTKDGQTVRSTQVARARWRDGKVVEERFFHG